VGEGKRKGGKPPYRLQQKKKSPGEVDRPIKLSKNERLGERSEGFPGDRTKATPFGAEGNRDYISP